MAVRSIAVCYTPRTMSEQSELQPGARPPAPKGYAAPVAWFMAGLIAFGIVVVATFFLIGSLPLQSAGPPIQIAGLLLLLATAAPAIYALRRGKIALGSGVLVGYALATVFSSGQCTLWVANPGYEMIMAFFVYIFALGGACVLFIGALVADAIRQRRSGPR